MPNLNPSLFTQITEAAEFLRPTLPETPTVGVILGTGLGEAADRVKEAVVVPFEDIPHFPASTVKFHAGRWVAGRFGGKTVVMMQGRYHYYEGYTMQQVTLPVRVMARLGVSVLILSNAAGGIRPHLTPGTLALIADHLNLMGDNPLIGPYDERLGERFPDMSEPYSRRLRRIAEEAAAETGETLPNIVYAAVSGPSYETAAEIRMLQTLGADAVGMSVVPEVLTARQIGLEVLAITAVTDQALPEAMQPVTHELVSQTAASISPRFTRLLEKVIERL